MVSMRRSVAGSVAVKTLAGPTSPLDWRHLQLWEGVYATGSGWSTGGAATPGVLFTPGSKRAVPPVKHAHMNVHGTFRCSRLPQQAVSYMTAGRGFPDPPYRTR